MSLNAVSLCGQASHLDIDDRLSSVRSRGCWRSIRTLRVSKVRCAHGRECALERAFVQDSRGTDLSQWLYNGPGDDARRGHLGYWIGYRIARDYVSRAPDRSKAIAELLDVRPATANALLEASGWRPACTAATSADTQRP